MYKYSKRTHEVLRFVGYCLEIFAVRPTDKHTLRMFLQTIKPTSFVEKRNVFVNNKNVQDFLKIFGKGSINKLYSINYTKVKVIDRAFPFIMHEDGKEVKYDILYNFKTPTTIFTEVEVPEPFVISYEQRHQYVPFL